MQLSINIEDSHLQKQITHYISDKHIQANDFMVELLEHFFNKEENVLNFKTKNPEQTSTTIDFDLEAVESYAKEVKFL